jgi:hypothetical protein
LGSSEAVASLQSIVTTRPGTAIAGLAAPSDAVAQASATAPTVNVLPTARIAHLAGRGGFVADGRNAAAPALPTGAYPTLTVLWNLADLGTVHPP